MTILETEKTHFCDPADHESYHEKNLFDKFHEITDVPKQEIKEIAEEKNLSHTRTKEAAQIFRNIAEDLKTTYIVRVDRSARTRLTIKEVKNQ